MQGLVYATLCDGPHPQVGESNDLMLLVFSNLKNRISIFLLAMTLNLLSSTMISIHPPTAIHEDETFEIDADIVG